MSKAVRGANSARSRVASGIHRARFSDAELESMSKDELISEAERLGVLSEVPRNGSTDVPLVDDLRDFFADARVQGL